MFDLVSSMIKAMEEAGGPWGAPQGHGQGPAEAVERLVACESAQELEREISGLVGGLCARAREELARRGRGRHREGARRLSERVLEEVSRRFSDPGLDISALGRLLEINPITLSRVFHEETGQGLLDHINRVRIERAKTLMRESADEPLEEICRRVGYGSSKTFTRAFKRREGVTPGRYRASLAPAAPAGQADRR
jgi:AraC-like DNA-binding protein